jgi:hypothetical protein
VSRSVWIGVFVGVIVLGLVLAVLAGLATSGDGSATATTTAIKTTTASLPGQFDLPLALQSNTLALAEHKKDVLVGLAVQPDGPVEIAVVRGSFPVADAEVQITVDRRRLRAASCGRGCFRVVAPVLSGLPSRLVVRVGASSFPFVLPRRLPPSGAQSLARARRTMAHLRTYHYTERLSSGQGGIVTQLDVQAPNRLRLRTDNGFRTVIIGRTRWDFLDGHWQKQSFPGLNVRDVLVWYEARAPRIVRRDPNGATELAAFALKPVPSWFRLTVEPSGRVSQARMIAPSHFMFHRYSAFDGGPQINPPR